MRSPCILFREMIKRQKPMTTSVLMYFTAAYINEIPPPKKKKNGVAGPYCTTPEWKF